MIYFVVAFRNPAKKGGYLFLLGSIHVEVSTSVPVRWIYVDNAPFLSLFFRSYTPSFLTIDNI